MKKAVKKFSLDNYDAASLLQSLIMPIVALVIVGVIGGLGYHFYKSHQDEKLEKAGNELFTLQKELGKVAEIYAPEDVPALEADKKGAKAIAKAPKPKASPEEMAKGFGPIVERLQAFVKANAGTLPAVEAALLVSEATSEYGKYDEGIRALQTATQDFSKKNFLYGVAESELGGLLAKTDKCTEAVKAWDSIIAVKEHEYMSDQLRLKSGVCFQTLGMYDKAEKMYGDVIRRGPETSSARMAKKFLLYIKYVKAKGSEKTSEKS